MAFNQSIAGEIVDLIKEELTPEHRRFFSKSGVLKRVSIPQWAKRAVYYRDRGVCVKCHRDLSGTLNIGNSGNYDHIVPLEKGGLNDVTNVQLLCSTCNLSKAGTEILTSDQYEA